MSTSTGEIHELKEELRVVDKSRKKDAVKKVIAAMTVGKDVSPIFPDVVNCMQTDDLELKKLVYLYLINYAKSQPDLAIMAVNTFVKVCASAVIFYSLLRLCAYTALNMMQSLTLILRFLITCAEDRTSHEGSHRQHDNPEIGLVFLFRTPKTQIR